MKTEIFKVQLSRYCSTGVQAVLIYNEDESLMYEGDARKDIKKKMRRRSKAFFHGYVDEKGVIQICTPAKWQDW